MKQYGIAYPVALDSQFVTWRNYQNHYWPAHYLINKKGFVVYRHFGEGEYDVMENNIRYLLGVNDLSTLNPLKGISFNLTQTPETYLGYAKADSDYSRSLSKIKPPNIIVPINYRQMHGVWMDYGRSTQRTLYPQKQMLL